jgi:hypothetical protein
MKSSNRRRKVALGGAILLLLGWWPLFYALDRPGIAESHEQAWRTARDLIRVNAWMDAPGSLSDHFRPRTWLWYFRGRPTPSSLYSTMVHEEKELIWMGVFDTEDIVLTNRVPDEFGEWLKQPGARDFDLEENIASIRLEGINKVRLSGKTTDIRAITKAIRAWDAEGAVNWE